MRGRASKRACRDGLVEFPADSAFAIRPDGVSVTDGITTSAISSTATKGSQVLVDAQKEAVAEVSASRVPTDFPAEQIKLWAAYVGAPRVFAAEASLLNTLAVLEVRCWPDQCLAEFCARIAVTEPVATATV